MTPDEKRREYNKKWFAARPGYLRKWNATHPEKACEYSRKCYAANPEYMREYSKKWFAANPEKARAHCILNNAIRRGEGVRPDHCAIPGCSNPDPEGHHEDYSKPLDVVWLCRSCHKLLHLERDKEELDMSKITDDEVFSILNNPEIQELAAQINATLAQIHELCKKEDIPTPGLEQLAQDIQGHSGVMLQD
jgi:hypothetical protein